MEELKTKLLARAHVCGPTECWPWRLSLTTAGYGKFYSGRHPEKHETASRVSYEVFKGPIPDGLIVCHTCDNRACINPDHLFLGTHSDNHIDMVRKGRGNAPQGVLNTSAKITPEIALLIRESSGPLKTTATKFGVSSTLVWKIRKRLIWRHI